MRHHRFLPGIVMSLLLLGFAIHGHSQDAKPAAPAAVAKPEKAAEAAAETSDTAGSLTLGVEAGDGYSEGFGDILIPIYTTKSCMLFLSPRVSYTDSSETEFNLGLGIRGRLSKRDVILGANVYYDTRRTAAGSDFNQTGIGIECLSKWVDFRANGYFPTDREELIDEYDVVSTDDILDAYEYWEVPRPEGNSIVQSRITTSTITTTTTTHHYELYEAAMDGYDAEIGFLLPIPRVENYADIKLFGGYYLYDNRYGEDIEGWKARLEVRALPWLYLDAQMFEADNPGGGDYSVGARLFAPFDVGNLVRGKNPFSGMTLTREEKTDFAGRMNEMVMRDLHVRVTKSIGTEITEDQTSTSSTYHMTVTQAFTLVSDVIFVNGDYGEDSNPGTYYAPVETIDTGMNRGNNVFVMVTSGPYDTSVVIDRNMNLMGQACPLNGAYLNGDSRPTVLAGDGVEPTIYVDGSSGANDVKIRGFDIRSGDSETLDAGAVGPAAIRVENARTVEIANNTIRRALAGVVAGYDQIGGVSLSMHHNTFDQLALAAAVTGYGVEGQAVFSDNLVRNSALGFVGGVIGDDAMNADTTFKVRRNAFQGGGLATLGAMASNDDLLNSIGLPPLEDILDNYGLPTELADVLADLPGTFPSLNAVAIGSLTPFFAVKQLNGGAPVSDLANMSCDIADNTVSDSILGIAVGAAGPGSKLTTTIHGNVVAGGGLQAIVDFVGGQPGYPAPLDVSVAGIMGVSGYSGQSSLSVYENSVLNNVIGIGAAGFMSGAIDNASIRNNTLTENLLGIGAVGFDSSLSGWTVSGNRITGGIIGDALTDAALCCSKTFRKVKGISYMDDYLFMPDSMPDFGAVGIGVYGDNAEMDNYVISGNTVNNEIAGVLVVGFDSSMTNFTVANNAVTESVLGIGALGFSSKISELRIGGNTIAGGIVGDGVNDWLAWNIDTNGAPDTIVALSQVAFPDTGAIGIGMWADDGACMDNAEISANSVTREGVGILAVAVDGASTTNLSVSGNSVGNCAAGIVLAAMDGSATTDASVSGNSVYNSLAGVCAFAAYDASMDGLVVNGNSIRGGGVDTAQNVLAPFANTNFASETFVALVTTNLGETGVGGVVVFASGGASVNDLQIVNNSIEDMIAGVAVCGLSGSGPTVKSITAPGTTEVNDFLISGNTIADTLLGVGIVGIDGNISMADGSIANNTIYDSVVGAGVLNKQPPVLPALPHDGDISNLAIRNNAVEDAMLGIVVVGMNGAISTNTAISGNAVNGALLTDKAALVETILLALSADDTFKDVMGFEWDPGAFANSGMTGITVIDTGASEMSPCDIDGNMLTDNLFSASVIVDTPATVLDILIRNNVGDAPYIVNGAPAGYNLTQANNVPSPVVEVP